MHFESVWERIVKGRERWRKGVRGESREVAAAGGGGTAEDEGGGGVHCGFIPANTFIMADLAEPVTHCRGYISASIPTLTFSLLRPLHPSTATSQFRPNPRQYISYILIKSLFFNDSLTLSAIRETKGYWIVRNALSITLLVMACFGPLQLHNESNIFAASMNSSILSIRSSWSENNKNFS